MFLCSRTSDCKMDSGDFLKVLKSRGYKIVSGIKYADNINIIDAMQGIFDYFPKKSEGREKCTILTY